MSIDLAAPPDSQAAADPPASSRPVRVGIVGAGQQATTHLVPALLQVPHARISAVVDPDQPRRDRLALRVGVPDRLATVAQLLDGGLVDCLIAACPPQAHEQIAAAAIDAGIPVFVEKPPATSTAVLAELAAAAERGGVLTGVGMNFRWAAPVRRLHTLVGDHQPSGPSMIGVRHVASKPTTSMWGLPLWNSFLLAQAIHPIDLLLSLAGAPAVDIQPACRQTGDQVWFGLQTHHANGTIGTVHCGNLAPRFEHRIEVSTTTGITANLTSLADLTVTYPASDALHTGRNQRGTSSHWRPSPLDVGYGRAGFGGELAAFCTAVATGGRFTPSLADLLPTYQIMDQLTPTGGTA
ncbi:Gfo/Idh/MocA family protein [Phytohabitans kaempferiae]|uniref:Gfo/Idh/MocA family protein n=1 Tax=Phytohabitans kaempferiae TaxID=1620943 RepID=A0ABV6MBF9_9ACTN